MTLLCVPITVHDLAPALADAERARDLGADIIEWRIDECFTGSGDQAETKLVLALVRDCPLPCIVTCRLAEEGGAYDGPEDERVSLFEALGTSDHPPAYIDVELAAYTRSANVRSKVNLAVQHPKQLRDVRTRLILSIHDFKERPSDLTRRLAAARAEPAASVIKVAYRARSIRDNLELFEILRDADRPTIALGMGEFGLMSRVLAPKFGGFLTFASLDEASATAPGQPTVSDLLDLYRFRSIGPDTKLYGVIGWPVGHSMSPLVHNAGFEAVGHDGVYLPLPVAAGPDEEATFASFKGTVLDLMSCEGLEFDGASVTLPHKRSLARFDVEQARAREEEWLVRDIEASGAANTILMMLDEEDRLRPSAMNTDVDAVIDTLREHGVELSDLRVVIAGTGGLARALAYDLAEEGAVIQVTSRSDLRAESFAEEVNNAIGAYLDESGLVHVQGIYPRGYVLPCPQREVATRPASVYINCTPVGMNGGPDPEGILFPVGDLLTITPNTMFFDTVYNPIETPMLKAAKARGCRTIDGVEMFVRQAALQFELWTGKPAPPGLFDRLVREKLDGA